MRTIAVLGLIVLATTSPLQAQALPDSARVAVEREVGAAQLEMQRAAGSLDVLKLFEYVLDSPTPIVQNGVAARTRGEAQSQTAEGFRGLSALRYSYTHDQVTALSPTLALWVGEGRAVATLADGREVGGPFVESIVFSLVGGKWRVLHAHRSAPAQ